MNAGTPTRSRLDVIEPAECMALLADHHLGRLAVVVAGQPVIFPITYVFDGRAIVFRTNPGTKLFGALDGPVAFEIDGVGAFGWSVVVTGKAELVENEAEVRRLSALDLGDWNPGPKQFWVRIRGTITGRRLVHTTDG